MSILSSGKWGGYSVVPKSETGLLMELVFLLPRADGVRVCQARTRCSSAKTFAPLRFCPLCSSVLSVPLCLLSFVGAVWRIRQPSWVVVSADTTKRHGFPWR